MSLVGADTDELRDAGQKCQEGKETTDEVIAFLRILIAILRAASFFSGGASLAYAEYLETTVVPWLQRISAALGLFAQVLNANAEAQDRASAGETVDLSQLPTYATPALPQPTSTTTGTSIPTSGGVTPVGDPAGGTTGGTFTPTAARPAPATTGGPTSGTPGPGVGGDVLSPAASGRTGGDVFGATGLPTGTAGSVTTGTGGSPGTGSSGTGPLGGGSGSGGGSLGSGSVDGATGTGGATGAGPVTGGDVLTHSSPSLTGGYAGATPGADTLPDGSLGTAGQPVTASGDHASYGAAAGIAGGAAALGLGGAALAGRGSGGDPEIDRLAAGTGRGSRGPDVKALQEKLTAAGYDTQGADGVWGSHTQAAYDQYRADHPLPTGAAGSGYTSPDGFDYQRITGIANNPNVTPDFLRRVEGMSQRLGARPEHILAAMSFETGGQFAADTRNRSSSATGLIQFMDSTARGMGTTTADLARMSPTEQLTYVERYFEPFRGRLGDQDAVYTSILAGHPASGDATLFNQGTRAYRANAPLDLNHDGRITAAEATSFVRNRVRN